MPLTQRAKWPSIRNNSQPVGKMLAYWSKWDVERHPLRWKLLGGGKRWTVVLIFEPRCQDGDVPKEAKAAAACRVAGLNRRSWEAK